jgi:iron uptake system component EfeO
MLAACGNTAPSGAPLTEAEFRAEVTTSVRSYLQRELDAWSASSRDLQAAAPVPVGRGWNAETDPDAVARMKEAWRRVRVAYEHVEGAVAPVFPELDAATDERYDGFLAEIKHDDDLFDGEGVTGMHAAERILYADSIPENVLVFERGLSGYVPAAFPAHESEAREFKDQLLARLVRDVDDERTQFAAAGNIDLAFAYRGTLDLVSEQLEKVDRAATGEEESRYSQSTMADLRSNCEGNLAVYGAFREWLQAKGTEGQMIDGDIKAGFDRLHAAYAAIEGDRMPPPPPTWTSTAPLPADLETPFGVLFTAVSLETDPDRAGSLASDMTKAGKFLGLAR